MRNQKLKAFFFDAAGTLFTTKRPVGEIYWRIARKYGFKGNVEDVAENFLCCFALAPPLTFPGTHGEDITRKEREWWYNLVARVFEPLGDFPGFDHYFAELFATFARPHTWQLFPDTEDALKALKQQNYSLGIITNFDSRVLGILSGLGIDHLFDSITISSRVGFAKPAPEIFSAALRQHSLQPSEAVHVGDSLREDIEGARAAGLTPILLEREGTRSVCDPFFRISCLADLPAFLELL